MNIRILHLFPKLLSLYGENGNVRILEKTLRDAGHSVEVVLSEEFPDERFDFIYVGSGTEDALIEAGKRLSEKNISEALRSSLWLATGNALTLFGKRIVDGEKELAAAGTFDFETRLCRTKRYSGDVITSADNVFSTEAVGFVNTSSVYSGISGGIFEFVLNKGIGNDKNSAVDGFSSENFFATQMIGPFLVKNPAALAYFAEKLCKEKIEFSEKDDIVKAYETAKGELKKRLS